MAFVVSGYYGFANAGDEAVLAGMLEAFAQADVDRSSFIVLSADPQATAEEFGVQAVPRMDMARVRGAIQDADAFISGGGSLFQDSTSLRSVVYYAWLMRMAYRSGKPVIIYAQGIGPLRRPVARWIVRRIIQPARHVSVRDPASKNLLRSIGVDRDDIVVTGDPAFALEPGSEDEGRRLLREAGSDFSRPVVGIAPRPWPSVPIGPLIAGLSDQLSRRGFSIVTMPMQPGSDAPLCEALALPVIVPDPTIGRLTGGFRTYLSACAALDVVVGMRLHGLIFGAIGGSSLVGMAYDPKVTALMETLGLHDYVTRLNETNPRDMADTVERAAEDGDARSRLRETVHRLRAEACTHAAQVLRTL